MPLKHFMIIMFIKREHIFQSTNLNAALALHFDCTYPNFDSRLVFKRISSKTFKSSIEPSVGGAEWIQWKIEENKKKTLKEKKYKMNSKCTEISSRQWLWHSSKCSHFLAHAWRTMCRVIVTLTARILSFVVITSLSIRANGNKKNKEQKTNGKKTSNYDVQWKSTVLWALWRLNASRHRMTRNIFKKMWKN